MVPRVSSHCVILALVACVALLALSGCSGPIERHPTAMPSPTNLPVSISPTSSVQSIATVQNPTRVVPKTTPEPSVVQQGLPTAASDASAEASAEATSVIADNVGNMGRLHVKVIDGCDPIYDVLDDGKLIASGRSETIFLPAGTYDVVFYPTIGNPLSRQIIVETGMEMEKETSLDFSQDLGIFAPETSTGRWSGLGDIREPTFSVTQNGKTVQNRYSPARSGRGYCTEVGTYTVSMPNLGDYPSFPSAASFDVEIKAGEILTLTHATWSKELGRVVFGDEEGYTQNLVFAEITNLDTRESWRRQFFLANGYWTPAGKYQIKLDSPYAGLEFTVDVLPGKDVVLDLPK